MTGCHVQMTHRRRIRSCSHLQKAFILKHLWPVAIETQTKTHPMLTWYLTFTACSRLNHITVCTINVVFRGGFSELFVTMNLPQGLLSWNVKFSVCQKKTSISTNNDCEAWLLLWSQQSYERKKNVTWDRRTIRRILYLFRDKHLTAIFFWKQRF